MVGDHVKVVAGRHEAETGLVVRIEPNLAVLLSDLTYNEVSLRVYVAFKSYLMKSVSDLASLHTMKCV